ncbi:hypothetical protein HY045_03565 [Candidatus Woesebacteria bacterium]|nr:hypothetical protein [Candidatus Woesebacteria bacterium]
MDEEPFQPEVKPVAEPGVAAGGSGVPIPPPVHPVIITPPVSEGGSVNSQPETPKVSNAGGSNKAPIVIILLLVFTLLFLGLGGAVAGVAYGKIKIGNPNLENQISGIVMSLPFTPKTPKYILTQSALAQKKVSKHSLNLSIAADSDSFTQAVGLNHIDAEIKGTVDYSDINNPRFTLNTSLTKDFNADIRKNDKMLYFKIHKILPVLLTFYGIKDQAKVDEVLQNWVGVDTTPLQTQARAELDKNKRTTSYTNEAINKTMNSLLDDSILNSIKTTSVKEGGVDTYLLSLQTTDAMLDKFVEKLSETTNTPQTTSTYKASKASDYLKEVKMNLWVGRNDYYVRKFSTTFKIHSPYSTTIPGTLGVVPSGGAGSSDASIALVMTLSDFGKSVAVETPTTFITPEKYMQMFVEISDYGGIINPSWQLSKTKDTARVSTVNQLGHALDSYYTDKKSYINLSLLCASGGGGKYNQWMQCLTDAGQIISAPSAIEYSTEGISKCDTNSGALSAMYAEQNGMCYKSGVNGKGPVVVYARLESPTFTDKCGSSTSGNSVWSWTLYSSADGRGGTVCTRGTSGGKIIEPSIGAQTFLQ